MTEALRPLLGLRLDLYLRDVRDLPCDVLWAWREARAGGVAAELRKRTLDRLYRHERYLVVEHDLTSIRTVSTPPGIQIAALVGNDWSALASLAPAQRLRAFPRRLAQGRTCFVAWRGPRAVGYTWLSEQVDPEIEAYALPLPADAAYHWDLYVARHERNSGVGSALVCAGLRQARARGFRRVWRLIAPANAPSLRTARKASAEVRTVAEASYVKLLGWRGADVSQAS